MSISRAKGFIELCWYGTCFVDYFRRTTCHLSTLTRCLSRPSTLAPIFFQGRRTSVAVRHICCWISNVRWLLRYSVCSELPTAQPSKSSGTDETYIVCSFTKNKILKIAQWGYMFRNEKCYWLKTISKFFSAWGKARHWLIWRRVYSRFTWPNDPLNPFIRCNEVMLCTRCARWGWMIFYTWII